MDRHLVTGYELWGLWTLSWGLAALWANRTAKAPPVQSEMLYRLVTIAGVALMFLHRLTPGPFAPPPAIGVLLIAAEVAGFAFCWWARLHLGRLWSSTVTRKEGHRIVDDGPYGLVRHPIYTGLDMSAIAVALLTGRPLPIVGALLFVTGCWIKARLEERFLRQELGSEAYDAYAARVPMLVPFWPK